MVRATEQAHRRLSLITSWREAGRTADHGHDPQCAGKGLVPIPVRSCFEMRKNFDGIQRVYGFFDHRKPQRGVGISRRWGSNDGAPIIRWSPRLGQWPHAAGRSLDGPRPDIDDNPEWRPHIPDRPSASRPAGHCQCFGSVYCAQHRDFRLYGRFYRR